MSKFSDIELFLEMKQPTVLPDFGIRWLLFLCVAAAFFSNAIQKISTPFLRHIGVGLYRDM